MAAGMDRQRRQWRVLCQRRALHGTPSRKKVCRRDTPSREYLELGYIFRKASHEYHSQEIIDVVVVTVAMKYFCFRLALSYFWYTSNVFLLFAAAAADPFDQKFQWSKNP